MLFILQQLQKGDERKTARPRAVEADTISVYRATPSDTEQLKSFTLNTSTYISCTLTQYYVRQYKKVIELLTNCTLKKDLSCYFWVDEVLKISFVHSKVLHTVKYAFF